MTRNPLRVVALTAGIALSSSAQAEAPEDSERVKCSIAAAIKYAVPANLVLAVAEQEGGKPGQWQPNRNGTHDIGTMQFNTRYLQTLAHYGITAADVAAPGCYAYELATWRLRRHLAHDAGDIWQRAANYHSRTPQHNAAYRAKLMERARRWGRWLEQRYTTREFEIAPVADSDPAPPRPPAERAALASGAPAKLRAHNATEQHRRARERMKPAQAPTPAAEAPAWVRSAGDRVTPDEISALSANAWTAVRP